MKNTTYLIIGVTIGYFMALGCNSSIMANNTSTYELGSQWNPMYVKIVD